MSDILQPGLSMDQAHPDADQLSAFAEHALPSHEQQQTLAHLATCADCRQIVFLAQQAVETHELVPEPIRARKPWFSGWNLLLPAALALAGIVAFSLHLRTIANPPKQPDSVTTARVEPPAPSIAPEPPVAPVPKPKLAPTPAEPIPRPRTAPPLDKLTPPAATEPAQPTDLPITKEAPTIDEAKAGAAAVQLGSAAPAAAPLAFGIGNRVRLGAVPSVPAPQQAPPRPLAQASQPAQVQSAAPSGAMAGRAVQPLAKLSMASPAPPPPQAAPVAAANETVTVDASAATDVVTRNSESLTQLLPGASLPSHLPVASQASIGPVTLALDSQGKLFRSKDHGQHWKAIKVSWQVRATKITASAPTPTALFVLTTDDGTTWTSRDGRHWNQNK